MTHDELVERAVRWLRNTRKCSLVMQEPVSHMRSQSPDAMGWRPDGWSIAVECKANLPDFHRDKNKIYRRAGFTPLGCERWYFITAGIVHPEMIPDGWGLAEVHGRTVKRIVTREWDWSLEQLKVDAALIVKAGREAIHFQRLGGARNSVERAEDSVHSMEESAEDFLSGDVA